MRVGDYVAYIGAYDVCTSGTWVIRGNTYRIISRDGDYVSLDQKYGVFNIKEFIPSSSEHIKNHAMEDYLYSLKMMSKYHPITQNKLIRGEQKCKTKRKVTMVTEVKRQPVDQKKMAYLMVYRK